MVESFAAETRSAIWMPTQRGVRKISQVEASHVSRFRVHGAKAFKRSAPPEGFVLRLAPV